MWLNAFFLLLRSSRHIWVLVFSSSSTCPSSSSTSSFLLFLLPHPSRSQFYSLPLPSIAARSLSAYLSHANTRRNSRNALEILRYRYFSGMRVIDQGKNNGVPLLHFGGDLREREISVLLLSLVRQYHWHVRVWSSSASCNRGERQYDETNK